MLRIPILLQIRGIGRSVAAAFPVKHTAVVDEFSPLTRRHEPQRKELQELFEPLPEKRNIKIVGELDEAIETGGIPEEHQNRTARIFKQAREATQSAWGNTKAWRIELDNRERWENPLMGWCSTGDPLSNIGMALKFASKEDAITFCTKNGWDYEVDEAPKVRMQTKNYGDNFSWNKRTRIGTK